jgi:DNA-binding SARP family transcriptional activator
MLELEPLHEEAHRTLMWFLATGGQRGAALAQLDTCRYLLREELGQEPSAATATLRDEIARTGEFTELPHEVASPAACGQPAVPDPRCRGCGQPAVPNSRLGYPPGWGP